LGWRDHAVTESGVRYFDKATAEPVEPGRFVSIENLEPLLELAPGVTSKPLVGTRLLASFVRYDTDSVAPLHAHVEEQFFMVLDGEIELEISGERRTMRPGDAALIPAWVPHSARSLSASAYQLDVFSPPRKAMLDLIEAQRLKPT
jgi:quercetin dioxygenase-like cupin family protein